MTTTINADTVVGGAIVTADASGVLALQAAGVTKLTVASSGVTLASALPIAGAAIKTVAGIGLNFGIQAGLQALGVNSTISGITSAFLTGGILSFFNVV